ncbi:flagellar protein [Desertibacillus haloalkaliphilus]|uniref:flagellar protein n=1 Tax=Desertibacillus haloalkaliphilus TaxID=1328930 RepID=UPI001C27F3D7|nr:flagellar protein [Desertibacillus haloalkaliphilus]MBU8908699.1 flagellar protein [Desertibacillus haloalkaliphilus]
MSAVKKLYIVSKQFYDHLQQPFPDEEARESYIEKVDDFLDKREELMKELPGDYTEAEKKLGAEIIKLNKRINTRLAQLKQQIQTDINGLKQKKKTGMKYENPYDGPTADGVFFDKKK